MAKLINPDAFSFGTAGAARKPWLSGIDVSDTVSVLSGVPGALVELAAAAAVVAILAALVRCAFAPEDTRSDTLMRIVRILAVCSVLAALAGLVVWLGGKLGIGKAGMAIVKEVL